MDDRKSWREVFLIMLERLYDQISWQPSTKQSKLSPKSGNRRLTHLERRARERA